MEVVSSLLLLLNSSFVALVLLGGWGLGSTIGGCSFVTVGGCIFFGSTIGGCSFVTVGGCIFFVVVVNSSFVALVLLGGWGLGSTIGGCSFVTLVL